MGIGIGIGLGINLGQRLPTSIGLIPSLGTLTLSGSLQIGTATSGTIIGATAGSTIAGNIPGITVNSSARTYSGTPTGSAGGISNGLVETLAGATGSPMSSSVTVGASGSYYNYRYLRLSPRKLLNGSVPGDGQVYAPSLGELTLENSSGLITHGPTDWTVTLTNGTANVNAPAHLVDNDTSTSWICTFTDGDDASKTGEVVIDCGTSLSSKPTLAHLTVAHEVTNYAPSQFNISLSKNGTTWVSAYDTGSTDATYTSGVCTVALSAP